jgi:hypothetical protein
VREILHTSGDSNLRRQAWEASKSVGRQVEGIVRELARLRNELARAEGYEDHHVRSVDLQELDDARLAGLMDDLEAATAAPFRDLKRDRHRSEREVRGRGRDALALLGPILPKLQTRRIRAITPAVGK